MIPLFTHLNRFFKDWSMLINKKFKEMGRFWMELMSLSEGIIFMRMLMINFLLRMVGLQLSYQLVTTLYFSYYVVPCLLIWLVCCRCISSEMWKFLKVKFPWFYRSNSHPYSFWLLQSKWFLYNLLWCFSSHLLIQIIVICIFFYISH